MNNLIGISGKIGSGKDLVGSIIQWIVTGETGYLGGVYNNKQMMKWLNNGFPGDTSVQEVSGYQIKKYADKLKDIVCLMIGCTRADLEDREFKEKPLGEEWDVTSVNGKLSVYEDRENTVGWKSTPRKLLQLMGTECGRQILHPNIWINALFADYKLEGRLVAKGLIDAPDINDDIMPSWIITDVRFPDEVKAIEDRGGIVIRLERDEKPVIGQTYTIKDRFRDEVFKDCVAEHDSRGYDEFVYRCPEHLIYRDGDYVIVRDGEHESETALDNHEFTHKIQNDGSIEELVEKVKDILNE